LFSFNYAAGHEQKILKIKKTVRRSIPNNAKTATTSKDVEIPKQNLPSIQVNDKELSAEEKKVIGDNENANNWEFGEKRKVPDFSANDQEMLSKLMEKPLSNSEQLNLPISAVPRRNSLSLSTRPLFLPS